MKTTAIVGLLLGVSSLLFLVYMGAFSPVDVKEETRGPFFTIQHERIGDYRNVGKTFETLQKELPLYGIKNFRLFAIYLDNPNDVPKEKLRCEVGAILSEPIPALPSGLSIPLTMRILPARKYLLAEFPLKNFLSIFLGIYKVYPKLFRACEERGCDLKGRPSMEIYEPLTEKKTTYLLPL
ncbi:GyrI-like domain-containing protein [Leptospira gomenensis]|uniref:GyrI-like domain-containing protein n=1 Tax=Leptospira gomenensis TaxID=2484974 RepID=A0A5F1Y9N9_9LEPT|nr:GyrI-like domain-containing protein [Leptospira gomenensis]TGK33290.1 GyrI-like domain-containing protein [Leptospira gomenensis]TGK45117.1 GyrI-like domain-containing protein [Leptospira gomenensis]TGK50902.1 GyrI-like domain-containing protein [Leptospira gomenensis]TGK56525.1 GyrI-like domain-containing protein [Leptospira gomenensis]